MGSLTTHQNGQTILNVATRGLLIVVEGLDRSGKTTQADRLHKYFLNSKGLDARIQRFPDRKEPTTGPAIDSFLRNAKNPNENSEAIHLLFAANRWLLNSQIREELLSGRHLIVDRYSYSGIAYSMAKGIDHQWACQTEVGLIRPDLVLFFDVTPDKTSARGGFGDEVMERSEFQQIVYEKMTDLFDDTYWKRIDASLSIKEVHKFVVEEVEALLKDDARRKKPLAQFSLGDFGLDSFGSLSD